MALTHGLHEADYSRMVQVEFVEDSLSKIWRDIVCLSRTYPFKIFNGCLLQILLVPFLNTLSHMSLQISSDKPQR